MQCEGAVIREQNVTFAVVIVKKHIVDNRLEADRAMRAFAPAFPCLPIVLMAQDHSGQATYFGRRDLSRFMANQPLHDIPWRRFTIN
jgi:hypothetical protein